MNSTPVPPASILFIGNSFTAANGGLDAHMTAFTQSMTPELQPFSTSITIDGATLQQLWGASDAREKIKSGAFELIVLQDDIPEGSLSAFYKYAKKFIKEANKSGTRPILFMAWAYERLGWVSQDEIVQAHNKVAAETGVAVAPVGLAWARVRAERPALNLFDEDREHPSPSGSYLAACVVYATVMGVSPEGAISQSVPVGVDNADYLERVAWETVERYRGWGRGT